MKVFLVIDDEPGGPYYAASTHKKAWHWIKDRQFAEILERRKKGWTEHELEVAKQYYADMKELHPYDIQEIEVDEKY